jgi:hypothetical protein
MMRIIIIMTIKMRRMMMIFMRMVMMIFMRMMMIGWREW